jgi:hypothetical protein
MVLLQRLVLALVSTAMLFAQSTASLRGTVTDPSGAGVPGASVTASGPGGLVRVAKTGGDGAYAIIGLPSGTYTLRIGATGFTLFESMQIELTAAQATTANAKLAIAAEKQEVTVTETTQLELDPSKNAGQLVLTGQDLDMLSDDPDDLQNDLMALAGPAAGPNGGQIFVDGFSNGQLPPKDSIREVRINSNPFSSEFDKIGFGRIEILTKPGTDKLRGTVFYQADTSALDARNPFATTKPSFLTQQFQGNLSGSLNKKTSFFLDFSDRHQDEQALVKATVLGPDFLPQPLTENVPTPTSRISVSPRIDYQWGSKLTLQARYTWTRNTQDNTGVGGFNLPVMAVDAETTTQSAQLTATWVVSPIAINETRFQYTRAGNSQSATAAAPTINVSGYFAGNAPEQGPQFTDQGTYELQNFTSVNKGKHFVKIGARLRIYRESDFNNTNFNGMFVFSSINTYMATLQALQQQGSPQAITSGGQAIQYVVVAGTPLSRINQVDVAPFIQDDWRVIPSLTLSLGLRYEAQTNIHDKGDFAPRVGVAWGLGGGQGRLRQPKLVIRGGFGLFYDRFALAQVLNAERFNGEVQQRLVVQNPQFFFTGDTNPLAFVPPGQAVTSWKIDPGLVAPRIIQSAIGFDRQLPKNVTLSVNYTDSRGEHELRTVNINAPLPGTFPANPVYPMGNANPLYEYQSSGVFKQSQLTANVNARLSARLSVYGYYSFGHAHSNTDGVNTFPANTYDQSTEWSRAAFDVRHRVFMGGIIAAPLGIRLSPFFVMSSAPPFNIVVSQDLNGDTITSDRPSYATAADIQASNAAVAAGGHAFVFATPYGFLNSKPTPGETIIPRNLGNGFGSMNLNLRVSRTWGFGETTTRAPNARPGGGAGGGGGGRGGGGPRGGGGGPRGAGAGAVATRRYNLTASVDARNLLNSVNPFSPVGTLGSPFFGEALGITNGFGGGGTQTANRRLEMQLRFTF